MSLVTAERRYAAEELEARVRSRAAGLHAAGVRAGDRVAVLAHNGAEVVEVVLACWRSGLVVVPVNPQLTPGELAAVLADARPRAVVTDRDAVDGHRVLPVDVASRGAVPPEVTGGLLLYTSGSTGQPRGVVSGLLTPGEPWARARRRLTALTLDPWRLPADGVVLLAGPWHHAAPLFFGLFPLLLGSRLVVLDRPRPHELLATVDAERVTHAHLVPTQLVRALAVRADVPFDGGSLRRVWHGGGPCPPEVRRAVVDWWGPVLTEYYGATEAGIVTLTAPDTPEGSVGRPVAGTEVLILADGNAVAPGEVGEVWVRRAGRTFTCGDEGRLDAAGNLHLTGRSAILTGGVTVRPAEVAAVLRDHPEVIDTVVFGFPDEEFGALVAAVVVPVHPARPGLAGDLDAHCRTRLAAYKVPRGYGFVPELPRDHAGKLRAAGLRAAIGTWPGTASRR
ncbi:AMP-binding protein [Actinosynnema sp. NPDC020468]|uniref:AMP-binding protein n=1 Tax=Actinosynnema sp. NPDC020468 TaxID=3154488 RepID=UPI0033F8C0BF